MKLKLRLVFSVAAVLLTNACSTYSTEDYGDADVEAKASLCTNMESAQEMLCKQRQKSLQLGLGADKNCNHPYEYERNRCKGEQAKQKQALAESLKKHMDKEKSKG